MRSDVNLAALKAAIRENPWDALHWSALADWAEEQGGAVAVEAIRDACRLIRKADESKPDNDGLLSKSAYDFEAGLALNEANSRLREMCGGASEDGVLEYDGRLIAAVVKDIRQGFADRRFSVDNHLFDDGYSVIEDGPGEYAACYATMGGHLPMITLYSRREINVDIFDPSIPFTDELREGLLQIIQAEGANLIDDANGFAEDVNFILTSGIESSLAIVKAIRALTEEHRLMSV